MSHIDEYCHSRTALAWSVASIDRYRSLLVSFVAWLSDGRANERTFCDADVRVYQQVLHRHTIAPRTMALTLSAIRSFSRWLMETGERPDDPTMHVRWPKLPDVPHRALTSDQLAQLHQALALSPPSNRRDIRLWLRNRRAVYLMLYAGLRVSEVVALLWEHIDIRRALLTVADGKGHKVRLIPLHRALIVELERQPAHRRDGSVCGHWDNTPMQPASLTRVFSCWLKDRGGPDITPHQLRHTCATELRHMGADLKDIQDVLGHASLATTELYLGPDPERLKAAIDRLEGPEVQIEQARPRLRLVK